MMAHGQMSFVFIGNPTVGSAVSENLVKAGYRAAINVARADAVFVYCETQGGLEDAFFDTDGLIQTARRGACLITLSATTPSFARELNAVALVNDLHSIEAPLLVHDVTLPDAFSDPANLSCFLAGEEEGVEKAAPLLRALASTVTSAGSPGSAQTARAALTIQTASQFVACMEIEALYKVSSTSSKQVIDFALGQGFIPETTRHLVEAVKDENFKGSYTIEMCMAEMTAALMAADDSDLILPGAEACMHLLELLALIGGGMLTPAALSLVYGEEALCAKHGLDWTRAEQTYSEEQYDDYDDDAYGHGHEEFTGGFGGYSSN